MSDSTVFTAAQLRSMLEKAQASRELASRNPRRAERAMSNFAALKAARHTKTEWNGAEECALRVELDRFLFQESRPELIAGAVYDALHEKEGP